MTASGPHNAGWESGIESNGRAGWHRRPASTAQRIGRRRAPPAIITELQRRRDLLGISYIAVSIEFAGRRRDRESRPMGRHSGSADLG